MRADKLNQFRTEVKTVNSYVDMKKQMEKHQSGIEREHDKERIQSYIDNEVRRAQAYNNVRLRK